MKHGDIIRDRLTFYRALSARDEEDALREIIQEIALLSLSNAGFFEIAAFHGGTALRLFHRLPRFSEDLDFALLLPDPSFQWDTFKSGLVETCALFGLNPEFQDRGEVGHPVRALWLKDDSIGKLIELRFAHQPKRKLRVKLEIDIRPPPGARSERRYLDFPVSFPVEVHDPASCFAGKLHAILCRTYTKGRDWFDLTWYVQRTIRPNLALLASALDQAGPWRDAQVEVSPAWLEAALSERVARMDWDAARRDVEPFLQAPHRLGLRHWSGALFLDLARRLREDLESGGSPGAPGDGAMVRR